MSRPHICPLCGSINYDINWSTATLADMCEPCAPELDRRLRANVPLIKEVLRLLIVHPEGTAFTTAMTYDMAEVVDRWLKEK